MSKIAFITGISGQDGAYLSKLLLEHDYRVIGGERRSASGSLWRLAELGIEDDIEIADFELVEFTNIYRAIEKYKPDHVYNLAAQSFVAASFETPTTTADVTGLGVCRVLEAIRKINPEIKFYQASSSEMFGKVHESPQNENTPFYPRSPYAASKVFGHWMTVNYRESYDMFACSGILFNHESPLRGRQFITRKITIALSKIKLGKLDYFEVGNLDAERDWGYAADYVEGMLMMLNHDKPDNYVLASGITHSVRDFVEIASKELDLKISWEGEGVNEKAINTETNRTILKVNPIFYRPAEVDVLLGDSSKAQKILQWKPKISFNKLVSMMVKSDYDRIKKV